MLSAIRERAKVEWIDKIPPLGREVTSDGNMALFTELTGGAPVEGFPSRHAWLLDQWDVKHKDTTTCNEFVGAYGRKLGFVGNLGRFNIAEYLKSIGRGEAWVPSTPDAKPKYGDICRFRSFHMGIALTWDYDSSAEEPWTWYTVESGQGGKSSRHDIIRRKKYPDLGNLPNPTPRYTSELLRGWVDIEILFGQQAGADESLSAMWLNEDGHLVHPDAPAGGGGPGHFSSAAILSVDHLPSSGLPHPWAPDLRYLDPLAIAKVKKDHDAG